MNRLARSVAAATPVYRVARVSGANRGLGFEITHPLSARGDAAVGGAGA